MNTVLRHQSGEKEYLFNVLAPHAVSCKQSQHFLTFLPFRCFFFCRPVSLKLCLPSGFGYFSVEHARSFCYNTEGQVILAGTLTGVQGDIRCKGLGVSFYSQSSFNQSINQSLFTTLKNVYRHKGNKKGFKKRCDE